MEKYELHREYHCYLGWREKPLGTGEAAVLVIPLEDKDLSDEQLNKLLNILKVTTFSEETVDFTILELDWIDDGGGDRPRGTILEKHKTIRILRNELRLHKMEKCECDLTDGGRGLCYAGKWLEGIISSSQVIKDLTEKDERRTK